MTESQTAHPGKNEVLSYWNAHPCGTQFTDLAWGSKQFFEEVERFRYETQPFMNSLIGFDRYRGRSVLEVGCGLGTDLVQFARAGAVTTGVDLTPNSIDLVKRRFSLEGLPVDARVADAEHLPFNDHQFDVVYSFGVLHHTPNTQKAVDEVYRVLKPGGEAIVMLYHRNSIHVLLGVPLFAAYRLLKGRHGNLSAAEDWIRLYDGSENPLGKAYSKREVRRMFGRFQSIRFKLCDPVRRRFPHWVNTVNQQFLSSFSGFYLLIRATKPA